jgi:transcriptional regulator with GAF, ATPase, and Fis domain
MAPECGDRRRCLHLVASAGSTTRLDGPFRRFPIGARRVGQVASSRRPYIAHDDLDALADASWLDAHRVQGFGAWPLVDGDDLLGVIAAFSRRPWSTEEARNAEAVAVLTGTALAVARARSARTRSETTVLTVRTLADVQREEIERALVRNGGRVSVPRGAAVLLGIKPTTLISRLQKLAVKKPARQG